MIYEKQKRYIIPFDDVPAERAKMPEISVDDRRGNFTEVETGFPEGAALIEAKRCLSCRRCLGCGLCLAVCEPKAIVFEQEDEFFDLSVDAIVISSEAGRLLPQFDEKFGYGQYKNVINGLEFERILSENGPYGGLILRPFDGDIPKRLIFIIPDEQNLAGRKKDNSALVSYTFGAAILALKKIKDLEASVHIPEQTDATKLTLEAETQGVSIKRAKIAAVEEAAETKNLIVTFISGAEQEKEEYDMLILSTTPEIPTGIKALYKKLGLDLKDNAPSPWDTDSPSLVETSVPNVFLI